MKRFRGRKGGELRRMTGLEEGGAPSGIRVRRMNTFFRYSYLCASKVTLPFHNWRAPTNACLP